METDSPPPIPSSDNELVAEEEAIQELKPVDELVAEASLAVSRLLSGVGEPRIREEKRAEAAKITAGLNELARRLDVMATELGAHDSPAAPELEILKARVSELQQEASKILRELDLSAEA